MTAHYNTEGTKDLIGGLNEFLEASAAPDSGYSEAEQAQLKENALTFTAVYLEKKTSIPLRGPERERLSEQLAVLEKLTSSISSETRNKFVEEKRAFTAQTQSAIPDESRYEGALKKLNENSSIETMDHAFGLLREGRYLEQKVERAKERIEELGQKISNTETQKNALEPHSIRGMRAEIFKMEKEIIDLKKDPNNEAKIKEKSNELAKLTNKHIKFIEQRNKGVHLELGKQLDTQRKEKSELEVQLESLQDVYAKHQKLKAEVQNKAPQMLESKQFSLLGQDPKETYTLLKEQFIRQFLAISPSEFDRGAFGKADRKELMAPNVQMDAGAQSQVSYLIAGEILKSPDPAEGIGKTIDLMERAYDDHQYGLALSLQGALGQSSVYRLKNAWGKQAEKRMEVVEKVKEGLKKPHDNKNYESRLNLANAEGKQVTPFIGVFLSDVTFITDGNPDSAEGEDGQVLVNLKKQKMIAGQKEKLQRFQRSFGKRDKPKTEREHTLSVAWQLRGLTPAGTTDDELYALSLQREPRT